MGTRESKMSLSLDNPTFSLLLKCGAILGVNCILKAPLTGYYRVTRQSLLNREDAIGVIKSTDEEKIKKAMAPNEEVERVARAHRNDLENIPIFMILALLYVTTNPDPDMAKYHFMGFTAARLGYSISYLCGLSIRGPFFIGGLIPMLSIGFQLILQ